MLSEQEDIDSCVIDCGDYLQENIMEIKQSLFCSIENSINNYGEPDVLLTYRCPFIIPPYLYERAKLGAFNIHPSLLPKYKGLNPWEEIFRNQESASGVTLHKITKEIDSGIIVLQKSFVIEASDTIESARSKADELAARLANEFISNLKSSVDLFSLPNKYDYLEAVTSRANLLFLNKTDLWEYNRIYKEGAFCIVFQMLINGEKYAVRCWKCLNETTKQTLCHRIKIVSDWIRNVHPRYMCEFFMHEKGVKTVKGVQPVAVMKWNDDMSLKEYLSAHLQEPHLLMKLSDSFVAMVTYFHNLHIAHGDMNIDNIRVSANDAIYVIDYDTFYVPTMRDEKDNEKGKTEYQHHARNTNVYLSEHVDYFSEYVIYLTIKVLTKYPEIWNLFEFEKVDSHIFNKGELANIQSSRIYSYVKIKNDMEIMSILNCMDEMWQSENEIKSIIPLEKVILLHNCRTYD